MSGEITLATAADWQRLREEQLTTVLDPMIFRTAELFLVGRSGVAQAGETWSMLSTNLAGLAAFFDAIVLHECLPIFDYGITFPEAPEVGAGASYNLVPIVNAEKVCVPKTSSTSCDQAIFVDQASDVSLFSDAVLVEVDRFG
jgi:hypothetical protein